MMLFVSVMFALAISLGFVISHASGHHVVRMGDVPPPTEVEGIPVYPLGMDRRPVQWDVQSIPTPTSPITFVLVDADTDMDIYKLHFGDTVFLDALGGATTTTTTNFNIRAEIPAYIPFDAVKFTWIDEDGEEAEKWERVAPYAFGGDYNGNYFASEYLAVPGPKSITVQPMFELDPLAETTLQFTILEDSSSNSDATTTVEPHPIGPHKDVVSFDIPMSHRQLGNGWKVNSWHSSSTDDYDGSVYYSNGQRSAYISLPLCTKAFVFYVQPNDYGPGNFSIEYSGGTVTQTVVNTNVGAEGFYVYEHDVHGFPTGVRITVEDDVYGFAVGQFLISDTTCPPTTPKCRSVNGVMEYQIGTNITCSSVPSGSECANIATADGDNAVAIAGTVPGHDQCNQAEARGENAIAQVLGGIDNLALANQQNAIATITTGANNAARALGPGSQAIIDNGDDNSASAFRQDGIATVTNGSSNSVKAFSERSKTTVLNGSSNSLETYKNQAIGSTAHVSDGDSNELTVLAPNSVMEVIGGSDSNTLFIKDIANNSTVRVEDGSNNKLEALESQGVLEVIQGDSNMLYTGGVGGTARVVNGSNNQVGASGPGAVAEVIDESDQNVFVKT